MGWFEGTHRNPFVLDTRTLGELSDAQFFRFCEANRKVRIERTAKKQIIIMPPTGGDTGNYNFSIIAHLGAWAQRDGNGIGFDSNTGFYLPNGAMRSPDAAWILKERWERLDAQERKQFPHITPDFIIELRSPSDYLPELQEKMQEWIDNGVRLAWLIDPQEQKAYVYKPNSQVEVVSGFQHQLEGEEVLPHFVLPLDKLR